MHALREEPPTGIEVRALVPGAPAPAFELSGVTGERWSLAAGLERGPVVLVFNRGTW